MAAGGPDTVVTKMEKDKERSQEASLKYYAAKRKIRVGSYPIKKNEQDYLIPENN